MRTGHFHMTPLQHTGSSRDAFATGTGRTLVHDSTAVSPLEAAPPASSICISTFRSFASRCVRIGVFNATYGSNQAATIDVCNGVASLTSWTATTRMPSRIRHLVRAWRTARDPRSASTARGTEVAMLAAVLPIALAVLPRSSLSNYTVNGKEGNQRYTKCSQEQSTAGSQQAAPRSAL